MRVCRVASSRLQKMPSTSVVREREAVSFLVPFTKDSICRKNRIKRALSVPPPQQNPCSIFEETVRKTHECRLDLSSAHWKLASPWVQI